MQESLKIKISPSMLSANKSKLAEELKRVSSADCIHWDIMDGAFVDAITFGAETVKDCRQHSNLRFDIHLMTENPEKHLEAFKAAGADMIIVHLEAVRHLHRILDKIKSLDMLAGIALNPATSPNLEYCMDLIDMLVVMSVDPGRGGQKFLPSQIFKISKIREAYPEVEICVDGGINSETIAACFEAGANNFVSGSYIFGREAEAAISELKKSIYG